MEQTTRGADDDRKETTLELLQLTQRITSPFLHPSPLSATAIMVLFHDLDFHLVDAHTKKRLFEKTTPDGSHYFSGEAGQEFYFEVIPQSTEKRLLSKIIFDETNLNYNISFDHQHAGHSSLKGLIQQDGSSKSMKFGSLESASSEDTPLNKVKCGVISVDWSSYIVTGQQSFDAQSMYNRPTLGDGSGGSAAGGKKGGVGALRTT
jgi:hypothetical protein